MTENNTPAAGITLLRTTSDNPDFRLLITELDRDLREVNGDVMDIYDHHNIIEYTDYVVLAYADGIPAGCGCFKQIGDGIIEVKRMFVRSEYRGRSISSAILCELEAMAIGAGYKISLLETGNRQTAAQALYLKSGYKLIPNYPPYNELPDSICYKKLLVPAAS